jgi:putative hemolysin
VSAFLAEEGTNLAYLAGLLVFSAFFSGSETALFSLSRDDLHDLTRRRPRIGALARRLVARPDALLVSVLFGNLLVNILYFSIAAVMASRQAGLHGAAAGAAVTIVGLLGVILFGEITPKAVAASSPVTVSTIAAGPLYAFHIIIGRPAALFASPVLKGVQWLARRLKEENIEADELRMLVELAGSSGALSGQEAEMIDGVVALSELRVREVMVPRVDVVFASASDPPELVLRSMKGRVRSRAPVYDGPSDNIVGVVETRELVASCCRRGSKPKDLKKFIRPVVFVPECARVSSVLEMVRNTNLEVGVVVDEYGGTAGLITLEDLADAVFGQIGDAEGDSAPEVGECDDGAYALSGDLSVRDWEELFEVEVEEGQFDTLGGFVTHLLSRIPAVGDAAVWRNLKFTVRGMRRRRVTRVELSIATDEEIAAAERGES